MRLEGEKTDKEGDEGGGGGGGGGEEEEVMAVRIAVRCAVSELQQAVDI